MIFGERIYKAKFIPYLTEFRKGTSLARRLKVSSGGGFSGRRKA